MKRRALRVVGGIAALALIAGAWRVHARQPRNDRVWVEDQARLPWAEFHGDSVTIRDVRDFRYQAETLWTPRWENRAYDLNKLETVWFVVTPFSTSWRGPAHTFVSFGFSDSQFVSISVEARKEPGEHYAVLTGLLRRFELMYVIGDERDLIARRALYDGGAVYLYPITAPREKIRAMFVDMLERADSVAVHPEFYNSATNNCTSNVIHHVNDVAPGRVPFGLETLLPGYADDVAQKLGLIDDTTPIDSLRARYQINARARLYADSADFSWGIRQSATRAR